MRGVRAGLAALLLVAAVLLLPVGCKSTGDQMQAESPRSVRSIGHSPAVASKPVETKEKVKPEELTWTLLEEDGYHDPTNPGLQYLQQPRDVLEKLPRDPGGDVGNKVLWINALREGFINPRTNIFPETNIRVIDLDVLLTNTGNYPFVLFPHRPHTEWLDCENCHEWLFASKKGETRKRGLSMMMILSGEFCGRCHGAVAFPLVLCDRCHSVPHSDRDKYED